MAVPKVKPVKKETSAAVWNMPDDEPIKKRQAIIIIIFISIYIAVYDLSLANTFSILVLIKLKLFNNKMQINY